MAYQFFQVVSKILFYSTKCFSLCPLLTFRTTFSVLPCKPFRHTTRHYFSQATDLPVSILQTDNIFSLLLHNTIARFRVPPSILPSGRFVLHIIQSLFSSQLLNAPSPPYSSGAPTWKSSGLLQVFNPFFHTKNLRNVC